MDQGPAGRVELLFMFHVAILYFMLSGDCQLMSHVTCLFAVHLKHKLLSDKSKKKTAGVRRKHFFLLSQNFPIQFF